VRLTDYYGGSYSPSSINTGSSTTPAKLANCAGAIGGTGTTPYVLQATSYVFWAETGATLGAAVMRDSYTTNFGAGQALWRGSAISTFMAGGSVVVPSFDVVGVAYNPITRSVAHGLARKQLPGPRHGAKAVPCTRAVAALPAAP
jgi:hypothetical protein